MILDISAARLMAQQQADINNQEINIYQKANGTEYIITTPANIGMVRSIIGQTAQLRYIESVKPSWWAKEENNEPR